VGCRTTSLISKKEKKSEPHSHHTVVGVDTMLLATASAGGCADETINCVSALNSSLMRRTVSSIGARQRLRTADHVATRWRQNPVSVSIRVTVRAVVTRSNGSDWFCTTEMTCPSWMSALYGRCGVE